MFHQEKSWERDQLAYGLLLFGSFLYIAAVTASMVNDPAQLTRVLITFGTLWCILAMGFLLHLHAKDSKNLLNFTSLVPRLFLVAFSYLVVLHISYLIPNRKAARVFLIVKFTLLSVSYVTIIIWVLWKRLCRNCVASTSPLPGPVDLSRYAWSPVNAFMYDTDDHGCFVYPPEPRRIGE